MGEIKDFIRGLVNGNQIRALLWKDFLVRIRQPVSIHIFYIHNYSDVLRACFCF